MANLLDTIRQNSQPQQQGVTDQTQTVASLLRAKQGKAVGGGDIGASNLGEQQAVANTNQTLQNQVAPQAAIQQAGMQQQQASLEQQTGQQKQQIAQQNKFNTIQNKLQTTQLLNSMEQQKGQLDMERDKAAVNQLATNLRLQNNQYVDNLQREGQRARLDDSNSFQDQLNQSILGDNQALLEKQLGDQSILSASDRDFQKSMEQMNIDTAWNMFQNDSNAAKERMLYTGIGGIVTAGVGAAGKMASGGGSSPLPAESSTGSGSLGGNASNYNYSNMS